MRVAHRIFPILVESLGRRLPHFVVSADCSRYCRQRFLKMSFSIYRMRCSSASYHVVKMGKSDFEELLELRWQRFINFVSFRC